MNKNIPTTLTGDKLKKAIEHFSEIIQQNPKRTRSSALNEVEIKYDLSPRECQFLNEHFTDSKS